MYVSSAVKWASFLYVGEASYISASIMLHQLVWYVLFVSNELFLDNRWHGHKVQVSIQEYTQKIV